MIKHYDIIVLGSGPAGYTAAVRAAQYDRKVAVIEKDVIGGVCTNWGCIPTKALLKSAQVYNDIMRSSEYGFKINGNIIIDFNSIIKRSRKVAENMRSGIEFLFKKNNIDSIEGTGRILPGKRVEVATKSDDVKYFSADKIIIAAGSKNSELPYLKVDGNHIISYREAMTLKEQPKSMVVVGGGAIGVEFAHFYNTIGTEVILIEKNDRILKCIDKDVTNTLERSLKKSGIKVITGSSLKGVSKKNDGCIVNVETSRGLEYFEAEKVLSAIGVKADIDNLGLEDAGINTEGGKISVNRFYETNQQGYYAIGDVVRGPSLAHVASYEAIICIEKMLGYAPEPFDYDNVPECIYSQPEVASVGMSEEDALKSGYDIKTGRYSYVASGKANATGAREGFIKMIFNRQNCKLLGVHMIGDNVTEMIAEIVVARSLGVTRGELIKAVHPHPSMSEAIIEAAMNAEPRYIVCPEKENQKCFCLQ